MTGVEGATPQPASLASKLFGQGFDDQNLKRL